MSTPCFWEWFLSLATANTALTSALKQFDVHIPWCHFHHVCPWGSLTFLDMGVSSFT